MGKFLQKQLITEELLPGTHAQQVNPEKDRKTRFKAMLSENTKHFQELSNILSEAPSSSSDTNTPGLREQLESVEISTLETRLKSAEKFIRINWGRIPDDGSWHGENKEELQQSIADIQECVGGFIKRKNRFLKTKDGGRFARSEEEERMLESDIYKGVLSLEAVVKQMGEDFPVKG